MTRKTPLQTPRIVPGYQRVRGPAMASLSFFFILALVAPVISSKPHIATAEIVAAHASPSPTPPPAGGLQNPVPNPDQPPPFPSTPKPSPTIVSAPVEEEVDEGDVIRVNSNLVTVPASVVDNQGRAMSDLKLEEFELRVDGQPKPISELSRSESPVRMVMLFDNSSSLTQAREFEKQAAERFFQSVMRPMDQAAIYSVSTVPVMERGLTSDAQALVRTIERFSKPDGATALFDAIAQAAAYLRPEQGRKVIVIVSDGADTISDLDFNSTLQRVLGSDCQIYAVQTSQTESPNLRNVAAEHYLQEFTSQTGGAVYTPKGTDDLDAAFAQISADLAQQYVLSYYPQDDHNDGRFRALSLRVTTRPGLRVRARKGYYAVAGQRPAWTPAQHRDAIAESRSDTQSSASPSGLTSSVTSIAASDKLGATGISPVPLKVSTEMRDGGSVGSVKTSDGPNNRGTATRASEPPPAKSSSPTSKQSQEQTTESTVPISGGVLNSKAVSLPKPSYPAGARAAGASGIVTVQVIIDENGNVTSARAISGHPLLRSAAVQVARGAKFSPTKLSGQPVKVAGVVTYNFVRP